MPDLDPPEDPVLSGADARDPADLRMPLLAVGAWLAALASGLPGLWPWGVVAALVGSVGAVGQRHGSPGTALRLAGAFGAVALAVLVSAAARDVALRHNPVSELAAEGAAVQVTGRVVSDPRTIQGGFGDQVVVRLEVRRVVGRGGSTELATPVLVIGDDRWRAVQLGAEITATGRLAPADDDVSAILTRAGDPEVRAPPGVWWRASGSVRAAIRAAVADRPPDQRALVPALVDGDDGALDPGLEADFATTGLTHLTAVSGTNLTLIVGFLLVLARAARLRGRWLTLVAAVGIAGFVLLARTEPSVLRAAVMGAVGLLALGSAARQRALRGLAVAVVVLLLVQPALATSAGFALSVLATAGIVVLAPGWRDLLARRMPRWLAEAVAVPLAAQVACTPVVAALSGQVSLVAVAANLLAGPVVGPATVLGLAGGLIGVVAPAVGELVAWPAAWCVGWIAVVARRGADLPGAAVTWGTGALSLAVLCALCVVLVLLLPWLLRRPLLAVLVAAGLVLASTVRLPTPGWPGAGWVMAMCDVGQGDALVLNAGGGSAVVVDAGPDPVLVDDCLDRLQVEEVPLLVLTHFHADHVDGVPGVLHGRGLGEVWTTSLLDPPEAVEAVVSEADGAGVTPRLAPEGVTTVGPVRLQRLWPRPGPPVTGPGDGSTANDASVVLLAEVGGLRILLTGDVEPPGQLALAHDLPGLGVDVLKVPHHGSRYQDAAWLSSLGATLALVSVGADNDYGHPAAVTLDLLRAAGAQVLRTDESGDIVVVATPDGPAVRVQRGQVPVPAT